MIPLPYLILQMVSAAMLGKKMILKRRGNTYFLAQSPAINKNRKPTIAQQKHMLKFSSAVAYAKTVMADPALKDRYRATKNRSKFNNAVRDYMRRPEVEETDARPSIMTGPFAKELFNHSLPKVERVVL